jgi:hypothetical protein
MKPTRADVEGFLAAVPDATRRADAAALTRVMGEVTGQPPVLWGPSLVGFGRYHYRYASGRQGDAPVVGFSPRKANLVLYLLDGFDDHGDLLARLGRHSTGRSCLYVKRLSEVDLQVLRELVKRSVEAVASREAGATREAGAPRRAGDG